MTYLGYFGLGSSDLGASPVIELVNSGRAFAYGEGLRWLEACDDCDEVDSLFGGNGYESVAADPAPWFDSANGDSEEFVGVVGLGADGIDDSTSTASTYQAAGVGGVAGALRLNTRTVVIRALAIGRSQCGLSYGINWLRNLYNLELDPCSGDGFYFMDCCPHCHDSDAGEKEWCWPGDYDSLLGGIPFNNNLYPYSCSNKWWPSTYEELITGPLLGDDYWCNWPESYRRLSIGPPTYACDSEECILKYVRMFKNTRIVGGPVILSRNIMSDGAAIAEIEFTVVAADPTHYSGLTNLPVGVAASPKADSFSLQKVFV